MGLLPPTIAVVTQPTRIAGLVARWATRIAARFRVQQAVDPPACPRYRRAGRRGSQEADTAATLAADRKAGEAAFARYEQEDRVQRGTLDRLKRELDLGFPLKFVDRLYLPTFDFRGCVAVVVVGRDGLVANAAKYVGDFPIVSPSIRIRSGSTESCCRLTSARHRQAVQRAIENRARVREITLAEVALNDGQRMFAFNDFFVGSQTHVSARYVLHVDVRSEQQSSSGLIVSTGAGSTGWLSSIVNMAEGFARLEWRWPGTQHQVGLG